MQGKKDTVSYEDFLKKYGVKEEELARQRQEVFENGPCFSIAVPLYQTKEKYLREMIESVLAQTYTKIEYWIIDGASSDHTVEIAEAYRPKLQAKGIRYHILSEPDNGIYDAMNKGIRHATGEIIGIINSDDRYEPEAVQTAVETFQHTACDLMYANINGWRFNEHKQYTFLRKYGRDLLLFVVNFDHISADLAINIPSHAFDFLQIPQMEQYRAVDLLTGKEENISLLPYKATEISVEGYSGKILKIKL